MWSILSIFETRLLLLWYRLILQFPQSNIVPSKIVVYKSRRLRTFARLRILSHTSCIAGHEGKHDAKGANISTRTERESVWHHGIAVCQVFSEMSRNDVTVRIDNLFESFAAMLLS